MKEFNKVLGGLFGVACGDALGATLEFLSAEDGLNKYGYLKEIIGGGFFKVKAGEITDDTSMTIAVARGILDEPIMPWRTIGNHFLKWYESNPKDIGNTVSLAIDEYLSCKDWSEAAYKTNNRLSGKSGGNGSLMRCIPVGLYYDEIDMVKSISRIQSGITHYAEEAALACELYNTLIYEYLRTSSKLDIMKKILENYPIYSGVFNMKKEDLKPTGYVVDTLRCALWCFINTSDFEAAVCEAVNLCGDADTIGAITGGLAGVYYGFEAIPNRWRDKIIIRQELMELGNNLYEKNLSKLERFKISEVTGIETYVGDYMGTSTGVKVIFERGMAFYNTFGEGTKRENEESIKLSDKEMDGLKSDLNKIGIQRWSRKYIPFDNATEGIHWSIKVRVGRKSYQSLGENCFPENWSSFCDCIGKLVGHDFK